MQEFKTLYFLNTIEGQRSKVQTLEIESAKGWRLVSENIEQGKFKGDKACCLFMICTPLALTAGHHEGKIIITLCRERDPNAPKELAEKEEILNDVILVTNGLWECKNCHIKMLLAGDLCSKCRGDKKDIAIRK